MGVDPLAVYAESIGNGRRIDQANWTRFSTEKLSDPPGDGLDRFGLQFDVCGLHH